MSDYRETNLDVESLITLEAAATMLGMPVWTLSRRLRRAENPPERIRSGRRTLFRKQDLLRWRKTLLPT